MALPPTKLEWAPTKLGLDTNTLEVVEKVPTDEVGKVTKSGWLVDTLFTWIPPAEVGMVDTSAAMVVAVVDGAEDTGAARGCNPPVEPSPEEVGGGVPPVAIL